MESKPYVIEDRNFQAGVILDVAHIKNGALVEFIPEQLPEKPENLKIVPDVFWQLGKVEDHEI